MKPMDENRINYRIAGDQFLIAKLGEEFCLRTNFRVITLCERLRAMNKNGIRGVSNSVNAMMIHFDPFVTTVDELKTIVEQLALASDPENERLRSRLIRIPIVYEDKWTRACAADFDAGPDLDYVAELNHMSVPQLIEMHQSCTFWVVYTGFSPGLASFVPIDPDKRISAPKYDIPRTRTPKGTLGIGGILQCIYPLENPGGYQMLGRTPLPIYDIQRRNPVFAKEIVLFGPGDRVMFHAISHEEYAAIENDIKNYPYDVQVEDWTLDDFPDEKGGQHV